MLTRASAILLAGIASFALGAIMFAGDNPAAPESKEPPRQPHLVAFQEAGAGAAKASSAPDLSWIGLMLEEDKDKGIRVANVFPGGPAAFAGIRVGDVVVKIGESSAESLAKAVEAIEKLPPQKPAKLAVRRGGKSLEVTVNPGSLAEFHERYNREMLRRDPRDPHFAQHHGVSDADMSVELVRRMFEQNQRLETTLHQVLTEVQALRSELRGKKK
jgi:membrane-associated protease RseP (regulator of RpoE activity)